MRLLFIFAGLSFLAACQPAEEQGFKPLDVNIQSYPVNTSVRALEVVDDQNIWYAGSGGKYGFTNDGGSTWKHDSITGIDSSPEFRAIAYAGGAIHLLNVGSPAVMYRSTNNGISWDSVYTEEGEGVFYDAMKFWDNQEGIAMGDPVGGCISVIITRDGGRTWKKLPCSDLPAAEEGEGAFAASNTNIALYGNHAWIVTGGSVARVFHSSDRGETWEVQQTPIIQGGTMTGIFSVDFYNENQGVVMGGDWEKKTVSSGNLAITSNGGETWNLLSEGQGPGYRSCIKFVPGSDGKEMIAAGIPGIAYSSDQGLHWQLLSDEDFYTLRFTPSRKIIWLAGNGKLARLAIN